MEHIDGYLDGLFRMYKKSSELIPDGVFTTDFSKENFKDTCFCCVLAMEIEALRKKLSTGSYFDGYSEAIPKALAKIEAFIPAHRYTDNWTKDMFREAFLKTAFDEEYDLKKKNNQAFYPTKEYTF